MNSGRVPGDISGYRASTPVAASMMRACNSADRRRTRKGLLGLGGPRLVDGESRSTRRHDVGVRCRGRWTEAQPRVQVESALALVLVRPEGVVDHRAAQVEHVEQDRRVVGHQQLRVRQQLGEAVTSL
jgi:hypothetical protein